MIAYPLLLAGLLLVGLPVLLHLLLRQKPRTLPFPAFRFLAKRHRTNLTKLRLRHILLMALRVLLLAAIVLGMAQLKLPKFFHDPSSLSSDQAVSAVFLFDTSASMEYTVAGNQTRLKEAQKRAVELLTLLPANSEVVVLDSADMVPIGKGDWLTPEKAVTRIGDLKLQPAGGPVSARLATALQLLARIAVGKEETGRGRRARVLCIFSDRATASWDVRANKNLQGLANQVPPTFDRLAAVKAGIPKQQRLLAELDQRLPNVGPFPKQLLIDSLENFKDRISQIAPESYPDPTTQNLLATVRDKQDELLSLLQMGQITEGAKEYLTRLTNSLSESLRTSSGFTAFYIDVGVQQPADLSLADLQLVLADDDKDPLRYQLRAELRAIGENFQPTLACDGKVVPRDVKAGQREFVLFDLDSKRLRLTAHHQAKVTAKPGDALAVNNSRFLTFAFRRVLLVSDVIDDYAQKWASAVETTWFGAAHYRCEIKTPRDLPTVLDGYAAVLLCGLKNPDESLWKLLGEYVGKGGGVGVIPGNQHMDSKAYNDSKVAQDILPGKFQELVNARATPVDWDWKADIYKHALLHPFQEWRQGKWDFVVNPRKAWQYWQVEARREYVLVRHADSKGTPALLERVADSKRGRPGSVLMFTTRPGDKEWNDYDGNSFYFIVAGRALGHLTGDSDRPTLDFICGHGMPQVSVPIMGQAVAYKIYRDGPVSSAAFIGSVTVEEGQNQARVPQATEPGNYVLRSPGDETTVAWFSVNLAAEESDLTAVPKREIEAVLGPDAVRTVDATIDMKKALPGHFLSPGETDLLPAFLVLILILLAVENLLANKFYRREPVEETR